MARIAAGPLPRFTTVSADGGTVAVINEGDQTISIIDTSTNGVVETLTITDIVPPLPEGIYDDNEWAGDSGSATGSDATIKDAPGLASGGEIALSPDGATISYAGIALSRDGRLLVAIDPSRNRVTILEAASTEVLRIVVD